MLKFIILLIVIIVLLILWYIILPDVENFEGIKPRIHAKIGNKGQVIYYSHQSPSQNGELGCTQVPCPFSMGDNITCWCCCNY